MGLLDGDIQSIVQSALAPFMLDVTYTDVVEGDYIVGTGKVSTETDYDCKGMVEDDAQRYKDLGLVKDGNRVVTILQGSLSVTPEIGDKVTIRSVESLVGSVAQDPAQATWVLGVTP
jgi:hypothetical protein